jgi:uncharacterized protein (DUF2062 family)
MAAWKDRLARWWHSNIPTRESLEDVRILRPVAHRVLAPELWRFTRRSVPRGVALGLFVGIFLLIPGIQIAGSALLALPFRANVPLAAAMTFLSNPATTPFILALSYYIGSTMLGRSGDMSQIMALINHHAGIGEWTRWLLSDTAPSILFGLFIVSFVSAVVGYFISAWMWRARLARKWRHRAHVRAAERRVDLALKEQAS